MQLSQLKITPKKIALLNGMDIYEAEDILKHYPFRYDENIRKEVSQWETGEKIFFEGKLCPNCIGKNVSFLVMTI